VNLSAFFTVTIQRKVLMLASKLIFKTKRETARDVQNFSQQSALTRTTRSVVDESCIGLNKELEGNLVVNSAKNVVFLFAVAFTISALPQAGSASVIYDYVSPNYVFVADDDPPSGTYTNANMAKGWIELPSALPANLPYSFGNLGSSFAPGDILDFEWDDGRRQTSFSDADNVWAFGVGTDASGNITDWGVIVGAGALANLPELQLGDQLWQNETSTPSVGFGNTVSGIFECAVTGGCDPYLTANADLAGVAASGEWSLRVPEPSIALLLFSGLAGIGLVRRRNAVRAK
jgi:hypothetical protein